MSDEQTRQDDGLDQLSPVECVRKHVHYDYIIPDEVFDAVDDAVTQAIGSVSTHPSVIADLAMQVERHERANRWRTLVDGKPVHGVTVLLYDPKTYGTAEVHHRVIEAKYGDGQWDHDNWHGPRDARPDDLWRPMPLPPAALANPTGATDGKERKA